MADQRFAVNLQQDIIALLCFSDQHGKVISRIIDTNLLEGDFRTIAERTLDFWKKHNQAPKQHTADLFTDILESKHDRRAGTYRRLLVAMSEVQADINADFVLRSMNEFIRMQRAKSIILKSAEQLDARGINGLEDVENLLGSFLRERVTSLDAGIRLSDIDKILSYLEHTHTEFKTGIKELDDRHIVPMRGKVFLILAPTGQGKCVAEGELVLLSNGSYVPIEQIKDGDYVPSYNEKRDVFVPKKAYLSKNGRKSVFRVLTRSGRSVALTQEHPLLTKNGWKPLSQLKVGDTIAVPAEMAVFGDDIISFEHMRILGYLIADGGLTNGSTPTFTKQDKEVVTDMERCLLEFNCCLRPVKDDPIQYYVINHPRRKGLENFVCTYLRKLGLFGKKSNQKFVPESVFTLQKECIAEFLKALFTCDGSIYRSPGRKEAWTFEYSTTSEILARHVNHLLTRFGIICKFKKQVQTVSGKPYFSWSLTTNSKVELKKLHERIGLSFRKGRLLQQAVSTPYDPTRNTNGLGIDRSGLLFFDKINEIIEIGTRNTFDLMVEDTHNFVANDILVHNTWSLVQLGKMAFALRKKVCHVTLEIEAEEVAQRYYQALFGASKRDDTSKVTTIKFDDRGQLTDIGSSMVDAPFTFSSSAIREELQTRINHFGMRAGNILIKRFPMRSLTVEQLEAYLENLQAVEHFTPDLVIVDYPKIMKTDPKNPRISIGILLEDLRGMAQRRNFALAAVHQTSKVSVDADMVRATHVAEDWSMIATSDIVVTYSQTAAENRYGLARLYVAKARSEEDKFGVLITQNYRTGQFVLESTKLNDSYARLIENRKLQDEDAASDDDAD